MSIRIFFNPSRCRLDSILNKVIKITRYSYVTSNRLQRKLNVHYLKPLFRSRAYSNPAGTPGSGAGKGGGGGGSVRESGGGLGQYGAAQEEQFFFNKQREQLEKLKKKLKEGKLGDLSQKEEK